MLKKIATMICFAAVLGVIAGMTSAKADEWDKKTTMTFTQPVEVPGMVLSPGTYVFKLLNSASDRHIVQVFNADETHLYTTILAIPNYRLTPTGDTVVRFEERRADTPEAIRAWFYPGDNFGQEFVYPKTRAAEIAETTKLPVLTAPVTPVQRPEEIVKAPVVAMTPERREITLPEIEALVRTPPSVIAKAEPAPLPPPPAPAPELPKTASPLATIFAVGFSALVLSSVLRAFAKNPNA